MTQLRKKPFDASKHSINGRDREGKIGQSDASKQGDKHYARRDENGVFAKRTDKTLTQSGHERTKRSTGESTVRLATVASQRVSKKTVQPRKAAFSHEAFASEAEYNQSVASVVARIQSGQVPLRQPDE